MIHLGADLLPKGSGILDKQKKFVKGFLRKWYSRCQENGVNVLAMFGNDDIYTRKKYFREYGSLLDEQPTTIEDYTFLGYPFVPDYPFGLKTACKLDYLGWELQEPYLGQAVDVDDSKGIIPIEDVKGYFNKKGTIEEDLKGLPGGDKAIVALHCPPQGYDLDVCIDNRRVGSKAITDWILEKQPALCLCGHIHESPKVSGVWKNKIGNTVVIQPGQEIEKTTIVIIEISSEISCDRFSL